MFVRSSASIEWKTFLFRSGKNGPLPRMCCSSPCSKGTLWTSFLCRNDKCLWFRKYRNPAGCLTGPVHSGPRSRRLFPSPRTLKSAFLCSPNQMSLYMHSYPAWSWGKQSNVCFELPIKRDLMAFVRDTGGSFGFQEGCN